MVEDQDQDIRNLLHSGEADTGFELLWQRYRLPCVQFLAHKYPTAKDDDVATAVTDAFLQMHENFSQLSEKIQLRNHLFFVSNRRLIDLLRKSSAQRRGGDVTWVILEDDEIEPTVPDESKVLMDEVLVHEIRERLQSFGERLTSNHQRSILAVMIDALPHRVYLGDFPDLLRERGYEPPCQATLKRSLRELRKKLADDAVLQTLREGGAPEPT